MTEYVIAQSRAGSVTVYVESDAEREERIHRALQKTRKAVRLTEGQRKTLAAAS